jgi:UrcA family protein
MSKPIAARTASAAAALTAALVFGAVLAPSAQAQSHADPIVREQTVAYGDLDLSQEADAREMLRRLNWAAFRACGGVSAVGAPGHQRAQLASCKAAATAEAVNALGAPQVQRAHEAGHAPRDERVASR